MTHKRFKNPRKGYSRQQAKQKAARAVDEALATPKKPATDGELAGLMSAPPPATESPVTPQSAMPSTTAPERMAVTKVVRGGSTIPETRETSPAQCRIDRLLAMLRRSR